MKLDWLSSHPGDKLEQFILDYFKREVQDNKNYANMVSSQGYLIYFYFNHETNFGSVLISHISDVLNQTDENIKLWASAIWLFLQNKPKDPETITNYSKNMTYEPADFKSKNYLALSLLKSSLNSKKYQIEIEDKRNFVSLIYSMTTRFIWFYYFIDKCNLSSTNLVFNFISGEISDVEIDYDDLFDYILKREKPEINKLIEKSVQKLSLLQEDEFVETFRKDLNLILNIYNEQIDKPSFLKLIAYNVKELLYLDIDLTLITINNLIDETDFDNPSFEVAELYFELSNKLIEYNYNDLSKLVEATCIEFSVKIDDLDQKYEILRRILLRSSKYGINNLINYINNLNTILQLTDDGKVLIEKLIDTVKDELSKSWDGLNTLVQINLTTENYSEALKNRFLASDFLTDKNSKYQDIYYGSIWAIKDKRFDDLTLNEYISPRLSQAIFFSEDENTTVSNFEILIDEIIDHDRIILLNSVVEWLQTNRFELKVSVFFKLMDLVNTKINNNRKFLEIIIKLNLMRFDILLESKTSKMVEEAGIILRNLYNSLDPSTNRYEEKLKIISKRIIVSSALNNEWELIDEAKERFSLMISDLDYLNNSYMEIYTIAIKERITEKKNELIRDDIVFRLFDNAIAIAEETKNIKYMSKILPSGLKVALKTKSFDYYVKFAILDMKIQRIINEKWLDKLEIHLNELLKYNQTDNIREIFDRLYGLHLDEKEEYQLLNIQFKYVDDEPDIIDSNEIYYRRKRLIQLSDENLDKQVVIDHYKDGLAELMIKTDPKHLNELLINAIIYSQENDKASLNEFEMILFDNFNDLLNDYERTKKFDYYTKSLNLFRRYINIIKDDNIKLSLKLLNRLITANLNLRKKSQNDSSYSKNVVLLLKESEIKFQELFINFDDGISEERNRLLNLLKELYDLKVLKENLFDYAELIIGTGRFFILLNESNFVLDAFDNVLNELRRNLISENKINNEVLISINLCSSLYNRLVNDVENRDKNYKNKLVIDLTKVIDIVLAVNSKSNKFSEELVSIKSNLQINPDETMLYIDSNMHKLNETFDNQI